MAAVTRRTLLAGVGACVVGGAGTWFGSRADAASAYVPGQPTRSARSRRAAEPDGVFGISTNRRTVALTFDDGPDPDYTPHVLDVLDRFEARATFFMVGVNALVWNDLAHEVVRRGHSVANHTHDHEDLYLLGRGAVSAELSQGTRDLVDAGLRRPTYFRPPKGYTSPVVGEVARRQGLRTTFWSQCVEANHPVGVPRATAMQQMAARTRPGDILLAHDGGRVMAPGGQVVDRSATMEALPHLLRALRRQRWDVVDLPGLARLGPAR